MPSEKRTALITGASSGIGRVTAIRLAEQGFSVIAAARRLERLEELAAKQPNIRPRQVDLSDPAQTENFCRELENRSEPVEILVNNAGYGTRGVVEEVALEKIRRLFEVNFFALIRVTQACLPGMRSLKRGRIVNVSSIVGRFPFPGSGVYASSKYAVEGITDAMRIELAPFGIKVVSIRPAATATEFQQVALETTGGLMDRTDSPYTPFYQTVKKASDRAFADLKIPGPEMIADLIVETIAAEAPEAAYAAGPLSEEFLTKRSELDDTGFYHFMREKFDLSDLRI
jgi:short-subunit dehydrogenase